MKIKTKLLAASTVMVGCVLALVLLKGHPAAESPAPQNTESKPNPEHGNHEAALIPVAVNLPAAERQAGATTMSAKIDQSPKAQKRNPPKPKDPIQDPDARAALSLVGTDPAADAYWMSAINNPDLPANERKDLIEDLNEDGLSNPKHPGPEDMPVILNRISLLEQLDAMDQVNADAMQEAYKDLVNLASGGTPQ